MIGNGIAGAGRLGVGGARAVLIGLLLVALAACSPVYRNHGYVPTDLDLAEIEIGEDTRETVGQAIGRPSAAGLLNDVGWYYVQSRWKHSGARPPREIERQVVAVTFDENGTVQNIERFGLENGKVVVLSRRVTESNVKGIGLIRQLLGSLGRISSDQLLN